MHELSVAQNLIDLACGHLAMQGLHERVNALHVRIGALAAVIPGALRSAFLQARLGTPLATARLEIQTIGTSVWCPSCIAEKIPADPRRLLCPDCGMRTPEIRSGVELELASIELAEAEPESEDPNDPNARSADQDPQAERRRGPRAANSFP